MKIQFERADIEEIATAVADRIKPIIAPLVESNRTTREKVEKRNEAHPALPTVPQGEWLKERLVALIIGIALPTLRNWRSSGKGPAYHKVGRSVRYCRSDVVEFMNSFPKIQPREDNGRDKKAIL